MDNQKRDNEKNVREVKEYLFEIGFSIIER